MEQWRDIPNLPGYQASNLGHIRRIDTTYVDRWGKVRTVTGAPLNSWKDSHGYPCVRVSDADKRRLTRMVHSLVLRAFKGERPPGKQARHLDGNPENNALSNLEWGTPQANHDDKKRHGTQAKGEGIASGKLTENMVRNIRRRIIVDGEKQSRIAKEYGVNQHTIRLILTGKTWSHVADGLTYAPRRRSNPGSFGSALRR